MIVSASRRTDVPAFFFPDFLDAMRRGFVDVRNPFDARRIRRVSLKPEDVDVVVFWTKNPIPMEGRFAEFQAFGIPCLVLFTLTPYGADLEPGVPGKEEVIEAFFRLSDRLGPERVSWRYDPVVIADGMDEGWHLSRFGHLARRLEGRTGRCIASFVSPYSSIKRNLGRIGWREPDPVERRRLLDGLADLAEARGMEFRTCAEEPSGPPEPGEREFRDLRGACLDPDLLSRIAGRELGLSRDPFQRKNCLCTKSVDVGTYGSCRAGCLYCYAGGAGRRGVQ